MDQQPYNCVLVSDFNLQNFAGYLANDPEFPEIEAVATPYGQAVSTLLDKDAPCWQNEPDVAVVWTRPEAVIPDFNALLKYQQVPLSNSGAILGAAVLSPRIRGAGHEDRNRPDKHPHAHKFTVDRKSGADFQYLCSQHTEMD
jgi:hypothetical protein